MEKASTQIKTCPRRRRRKKKIRQKRWQQWNLQKFLPPK